MILGISGLTELTFSNKRKLLARLESLFSKSGIETVITHGRIGVETFVAHWVNDNTDVENIVLLPCCQWEWATDKRNYGLDRTQLLEMPHGSWCDCRPPKMYWESYKKCDEKFAKLCDEFYFYVHDKRNCLSLKNLVEKKRKCTKLFKI